MTQLLQLTLDAAIPAPLHGCNLWRCSRRPVDAGSLGQVAIAGRQEADAGAPLLKLRSRPLVYGHVQAEFAQKKGPPGNPNDGNLATSLDFSLHRVGQ